MKFNIYHQLGHQYKWNLDSIKTDNSGSGIIISPKHITPNKVENLQFPKNKSIFDPQFFLPSHAQGKLSEYSFFPSQAVDDFSTSSYKPHDVQVIADGCVNFQFDNDFEYIVIPGRPYGNNPNEYINEQTRCFITPFLNILNSYSGSKPILLQIVINSSYILNQDYFDEILNWITSLNKINGVYLIIESGFREKQIENINYLFLLMKFINVLEELNDIKIILGYCNLEALVLSIAGPSVMTIGSYENTRRFKLSDFEEKQEGEIIRGPNARLYFSKLLQLVEYGYLDSIVAEYGYDFFDLNNYQAHMMQPDYNWHFTKPESYKHFFKVFSEQLNQLAPLQLYERYAMVKSMIVESIQNYETLSELIVFNKNSRGDHLEMWLTAANRFAKFKGWI